MFKKVLIYGSVVLVGVLVVAFVFGGIAAGVNTLYIPQPDKLLPSDPAYKQVVKPTNYVIYDTRGYQYFVTYEVFEAMKIPQKIGDGLYRLPDGSLVGIPK
jgi:hypothetical protein